MSNISFNECGFWFYLPVAYLILETISYSIIMTDGYYQPATTIECAWVYPNLMSVVITNCVLIKSMFDNFYANNRNCCFHEDFIIHSWTWIIWIFWVVARFWSLVSFSYIQSTGLVDNCFDDMRLYNILVESAIVFMLNVFILIVWGVVEAINCCVICDKNARKRRCESDLAKTKKALEEKNKEVELREIKLKEFEQKLEEEQTKRKIAEEKLRDETAVAIPVADEPTVAEIVDNNNVSIIASQKTCQRNYG